MSQLDEAREIIASLVETLEEYGHSALEVVTEARWFLDETQPKLYVVQFRSMRTAIHNIAILERINDAQHIQWLLEHPDDVADGVVEAALESGLVEVVEIDHRNPPKERDGYKLVYLTGDVVPDCYYLG